MKYVDQILCSLIDGHSVYSFSYMLFPPVCYVLLIILHQNLLCYFSLIREEAKKVEWKCDNQEVSHHIINFLQTFIIGRREYIHNGITIYAEIKGCRLQGGAKMVSEDVCVYFFS
jgi:hypothetical protein